MFVLPPLKKWQSWHVLPSVPPCGCFMSTGFGPWLTESPEDVSGTEQGPTSGPSLLRPEKEEGRGPILPSLGCENAWPGLVSHHALSFTSTQGYIFRASCCDNLIFDCFESTEDTVERHHNFTLWKFRRILGLLLLMMMMMFLFIH